MRKDEPRDLDVIDGDLGLILTCDDQTLLFGHLQFMLECGWGGREIDPASWQPVEITHGPSLWGHERVWLADEDRALAREMRMNAARQGLRAPVQVLEANYTRMSGTCMWW